MARATNLTKKYIWYTHIIYDRRYLYQQDLMFQLVRETKGAEATPSGWRPGKATLKPGIDLVGKVWKE